jgi:predicted RNase H-like HicB family nuclease
MRYAIVVENADPESSASVPDLPDCVATAATVEEVGRGIREASEFHLGGCAQTDRRSLRHPAPPAALTSRPNPALNRTGRFMSSTGRASSRPAGWQARQAAQLASPRSET